MFRLRCWPERKPAKNEPVPFRKFCKAKRMLMSIFFLQYESRAFPEYTIFFFVRKEVKKRYGSGLYFRAGQREPAG